jgi:hypothetical protein
LFRSLNGLPYWHGFALCSQWGLVCVLWYISSIGKVSFSAPCFASLFASSFPCMPLCALTLCMCSVDNLLFICLMISCSSSLFGWLFCDVGCLSCVLMRYMELRLSVNMYVDFVSLSVSLIVSCMAVNSALRIFWSPSSLCAILMFLSLL